MVGVGRAAAAAACAAAAAIALAGCDTGSWPSAQGQSASLPATSVNPNDESDAGMCAVLTQQEVQDATGLQVGRVSDLDRGCAWQETESGSGPIVNLSMTSSQAGDSGHLFADTRTELGDPAAGDPGIGAGSFFARGDAGDIYWLQNGQVVQLKIQAVASGIDRQQAALTLARQSSARLGDS